MASVDVHNLEGSVVGSIDLPAELFGIEPSEAAIYQAVKAYLTNQRQGNASTLTRAEVDLTKRKMYRQKGTGRARMGTVASPIRVGGGVAHGPKPRNLHERLPKKVKRLAIKSALSLKASGGAIRVVEDFSMDAPKTRTMVAMARAIQAGDGKVLLLTEEAAPNVVKSCRNIPGFVVRPAVQVCTYDVMGVGTVVLTSGAVGRLQALWGAA